MRAILFLLLSFTIACSALCSLVDDGDAKATKKDFDGAIIDYNKAIEMNEDPADAYYNRGNVKRAKGDLDGAVADYTKAIALKTNFTAAYVNRGNAEAFNFDFDNAIVDYNKAIEQEPGDINLKNLLWFATRESTNSKPVLYIHRGGTREYVNDNLDGAIEDFTKAIELKPDFAEAYFVRGYAKKNKDDLDGAIADYSKAIEFKPDYAWAYNNRGWIEFLKKDFYNAETDATRAIQLNSTNRSFYDTRGWARFELGNTNGALEDAQRSVGLSQIGTWAAVETQGLVNFINGDYHMAFEQWNNTFQHDTNKQYLLPFIEKAKAKQALPR